jgi:ferrous-iron efflux pump FieF
VTLANDHLRRRATYASVAVAVTLIATKLVAYLVTDSVAILSSLLDSTIDLMSSVVTVYGVASALRPPDHDHRFGHGKAEPLSVLAQAAFIIGSSVLLGYTALNRFYHPQEIQNEKLGYSVMALAIILTAVLVQFQHYVVRRTSSVAIAADRIHYVGDLGINIAVVVAFGLYQGTGLTWFDPAFALMIAAWLTFTASRIAFSALNILMDKELPDEDREKIKAIVENHPAVRGLHTMRTRTDSDRAFMELHVAMDAHMTLREAHVISEAISQEVRKAFPSADIIIHQDPEGHDTVRRDG